MSRRLLFITGTFSIGVHCSRPPPPQCPSWNHKAVCTGVRWLSSKHSSLTCWNCGKLIHLPEDSVQFLCPCENGVILPPTTQNYFKIMGCPVSFKLDIKQLRDTYKRLQRVLHPDRFSTKSEREQEYSALQSSSVNKAYSTLLKPYSRGLYLLELNGLTISESDNSAADSAFLEQMMEVNEQIREGNLSPQRLKDIRALNNSKLQECINEVESCFERGDYLGAKGGLARLKYLMNIEEELVQMLAVE